MLCRNLVSKYEKGQKVIPSLPDGSKEISAILLEHARPLVGQMTGENQLSLYHDRPMLVAYFDVDWDRQLKKGTVYFASLRISRPRTKEIYGWCGWGFYIAAYGPYNHKFPGSGSRMFEKYRGFHVPCNLQAHSLQGTSLHKDCLSAGEPYDVDQLVVKYCIQLEILYFKNSNFMVQTKFVKFKTLKYFKSITLILSIAKIQ